MKQLEDEDPNLTCLIKGYKIERSSVAQAPYYALQSFELNKAPI